MHQYRETGALALFAGAQKPGLFRQGGNECGLVILQGRSHAWLGRRTAGHAQGFALLAYTVSRVDSGP